MTATYILRYRDFGRTYEITIEAHGVFDAITKAKEICEDLMVITATLYTKSGKSVII